MAEFSKLRWWRDRARIILMVGLALYSLGFFMDWPFDLAASGAVRWLGASVMLCGAGCGLLWFVDAGR